ncbi:MAG: MFS transporter [Hyphomicrobiales bacterium]|nr:MFS transporter [Hyphomicrobiales bacterium]MBV8242811.1 MFS transporter [Hyphomicrobiales bacterium]
MTARAPIARIGTETLSPMDALADRREAEPLTHRQTLLIVLGVLLPTFMGSLDQTILATALPTIGRDFGDIHSLPWLITAYLLASTAIIPLYGKIADIHGRRFTLRIAILTYMAGSLVCALAPSMLVLIFGRVLHGLGGGGLSSMGMIVLADLVSPKERGRYYGYFAATYTTAGGCGPLLGGLIADHLHWSVIFWINIPMGLAALAITTSLLRRLPRHERPHLLDIIGAALIVMASVSFMLALNLAGARYPWTSPPILALFAVALIIGSLFVLRLLTAPEPLIPVSMLKNPIVRCAIVANAFGWGSIIGLNVFLPIYLQGVMGLSPTHAGLSLVVLMVALNTSAGLAGQVLGRVRRYKRLPTAALLLSIAAVTSLAWHASEMTPLSFEFTLILVGAGFGPMPSLTAVALQNVVARHQLGISVGAMNFSRNLLATMLIAVFGAIVLAGTPPGQSLGSALQTANPAEAFGRLFLVAAASMSIALIAIVVMEEKPLQAGTEIEAG